MRRSERCCLGIRGFLQGRGSLYSCLMPVSLNRLVSASANPAPFKAADCYSLELFAFCSLAYNATFERSVSSNNS